MPRGRFERWRVSIPAGISRGTTPDEWSDAVVLVEHGTLEVLCRGGASARFGSGSLLALGWLPLSELRNPGSGDLTLLAVRRRRVTRPGAAIPAVATLARRSSMALAALLRGAGRSGGGQPGPGPIG